jgi:hypothetical protein
MAIARTCIASATLALLGCTPTYAGFLRVPVAVGDEHPGGMVVVHLPLVELRRRLDDFDPERAAYFFRGRTALPYRYVDTDDDGAADEVVVKLPPDEAEYWVIVVMQQAGTPQSLPEGGSARGVAVDWDDARR